MKKNLLLFLFVFLLASMLPQNISAASTNKKVLPYEITSIQINENVIEIKGWAMAVNTHHYDSEKSHEYILTLTSENEIHKYVSKPTYNSQTNTMRVLNVRKCGQNEYYQQGGTCYYNYDYVGFSFEIPLDDLTIDKTYQTKLTVHSNILNFEKSTDIFYPILTPLTLMRDKIEYKISSNLYETNLKVADYAVFDRISPSKDSKIRRSSTMCSPIYGYHRFFDEGSVYEHIFDRYVNESTVYYKVKTTQNTSCKLGRNVISEGKDYESWIAGNWVDFSGEALSIEVTDKNQPPIINILEHPMISFNDIHQFNFRDYIEAIDPEDGNLTDEVIQTNKTIFSKPGKYSLELEVYDQDGKKAQNILNVTVVQGNTAPFIEANNITIYQYDTFDYLENVSAIDKEDGDVSESLEYQGFVDTNVLGEYSVTYTAHDHEHLTSSKTILVKVIRNPKEKIRYISLHENLLFYKEQIPSNWKDMISYLIEQLEDPKEFVHKHVQL